MMDAEQVGKFEDEPVSMIPAYDSPRHLREFSSTMPVDLRWGFCRLSAQLNNDIPSEIRYYKDYHKKKGTRRRSDPEQQ